MSAFDLSSLKTEKSDLDKLTPEQRAAVDALAEENAAEGQDVTTAFLVVVEGGEIYVNPDLDTKLIRERMPTPDDIFGAVSVVSKDLASQETAQLAVLNFQSLMQAQMNAMQNQRLASGLQL